jgi:LysM repeat protein
MPQYKIKSGDTLSQIAKSKGFTLNQLKSANPNITDMNKIKAGATLKLPYAASKVGSKRRTGATVGGSTKKSPFRGMTKTQMADLQPKKKGTVKKRKVSMTPPPKPKARPKKAIDRMRRKRLYSTKSPSMGKR